MKGKKCIPRPVESCCNGRLSKQKLAEALIVTTSGVPSPSREQRVVVRTQTFNTGGHHGLRVSDSSDQHSGSTPKDKREQARRRTPRRHTLAISSTGQQKDDQSQHEKKREAFKDMLAKRFPRSGSSDRGDSSASEDGFPTKPGPGSRNATRRRTTVVTYNPDTSHSTDHDERNTSLSEVDTESLSGRQGLQRGGLLRSSLPIVRSPNHSFERPLEFLDTAGCLVTVSDISALPLPPLSLGLVFLRFGDETKRALLPNEITHLDTVRALFVRSFPDKINMQLFESRPQLKIYIQDQKSGVFYQLEDLRDIQDHSVLKLHYCDSHEPQRVKEYTKVRGKSILSPPTASRSPSCHGNTGRKSTLDQASAKSKSLPAANAINLRDHIHVIGPQQMHELPEIRYRPLTPDVAHTSPDNRWRLQQSTGEEQKRIMLPERPFSPDRLALGTIPENRQSSPGTRKPVPPRDLGGQRSNQSTPTPRDMAGLAATSSGRSTPTKPPPSQYTKYRPLSPSIEHLMRSPLVGQGQRPAHGYYGDSLTVTPPTKAPAPTYVAKSVRAVTTFSPLRATGPTQATRDSRDQGARSSSRHSLAFAPLTPGTRQQQQHSRLPKDGHDGVGVSRSHSISPQRSGWVTNHASGQACQRSQSYRVQSMEQAESRSRTRSVTPTLQINDNDPESRFRMDKMEAQLANLTAWVHTATKSATSGSGSEQVSRSSSARSIQSDGAQSTSSNGSLNDLSTLNRHTQTTAIAVGAPLSQEVANGLLALYKKTQELKQELKGLRRLQQLNMEGAKESIQDVYAKIQATLLTVPGANNRPIRQLRFEVDTICDAFKMDEDRIKKELADLETSVEEMRSDVISRQCRVNMSDVEGMALQLSQITKSLADLKGRLPSLIDQLKSVMSGEMEIVVTEEKFLKEEPDTIESCLKKCKKLTGTLFTLKRLASVQVQRPPQIPTISTNGQAMDAKNLVLENIQSMVPNHDARLQSLEAADASRERKRRLLSHQESLKFEKKLELASKNLKSSSEVEKEVGGSTRSPELEKKPTLPLTEITEKISNIGKNSATSSSKSRNVPKTLTITKSVSTDGNGLMQVKSQQQTAREAFFSSLTSRSPTSPPKITPKLDWVVKMPKSQSVPGVASTIAELAPLSNAIASASTRIPTTTAAAAVSGKSSSSNSKVLDSKPPISIATLLTSIPQPVRGQSENGVSNILHSRSRSAPGRDGSSKSSVVNGEAEKKRTVTVDTENRRGPPPPLPRRTTTMRNPVPMTQSSSNSFTSFCSTIVSPSKLDFSTADQPNNDVGNQLRKLQGRTVGLPVASTPVVRAPRKPANRFEEGIMDAVLYANVKSGSNGETRSSSVECDFKVPVLRKDGQVSESGNGNESEDESTSSVDSQHEIWRLRPGVKPQTQNAMPQLKSEENQTKTDAPPPPIVVRSITQVSGKKKLPPPPPPVRKTSVLTRRDLAEHIQEQSSKTKRLQDQHNKLEQVERQQGEVIHQHRILETDQTRKKEAKKMSGK